MNTGFQLVSLIITPAFEPGATIPSVLRMKIWLRMNLLKQQRNRYDLRKAVPSQVDRQGTAFMLGLTGYSFYAI